MPVDEKFIYPEHIAGYNNCIDKGIAPEPCGYVHAAGLRKGIYVPADSKCYKQAKKTYDLPDSCREFIDRLD